jgi:hypothetical protein
VYYELLRGTHDADAGFGCKGVFLLSFGGLQGEFTGVGKTHGPFIYVVMPMRLS